MKKLILAVVAVGLLAVTASAQTYDLFTGTRVIALGQAQNLVPGASLVTNGPVDHVRLTGRVLLAFCTTTNTGATGGTLTATVYGSPDQTNLTAVTSMAVVTPTTLSYTNGLYGGTNLVANNSVLLPGTVTYPNVASGGWATPYLAPAAFTNTGAITLTANKTTLTSFNVDDQSRYLYVVYNTGGTVTNFTSTALLIGTEK